MNQKEFNKATRLLIILLILWNIILTGYLIHQHHATQEEKLNNQIMIEEFIPPYNLQPIGE